MIYKLLAWFKIWLINAINLNETDIRDCGIRDKISLQVLEIVENEKTGKWIKFHEKYG